MTRLLRWKNHLLALAFVGFIFFLVVVSVNKMLDDPKAGPPKGRSAAIGDLVLTSRACQTFVAQYDGLYRVQVMLNDMGREKSEPFHFYLRTTPDPSRVPDDAEDLVSLTHDALDVINGFYHTFEFPPIEDSAEQSYAFCMEAPQAPLDRSITAIGVWDDWYPEGEAVIRDMWGGDAGVRDLDFHLGYRLSLWDKLRILSERLVANKPFLCGARWFYVVLGVAYLVLLYGLFVKVMPPGDPGIRE